MTLYEITKKYGEGKGEDTMWKTVRLISEEVDSKLSDSDKAKLMRKVVGLISDSHYTKELAANDIEGMFYTDAEGNEHKAPYWPHDAVASLYSLYEEKIPEYNVYDFEVVMNMIASDNWCLLKKWFPSLSDNEFNDRIAQMSANWLADEDWPTNTKIWDYMSSR